MKTLKDDWLLYIGLGIVLYAMYQVWPPLCYGAVGILVCAYWLLCGIEKKL